MINNVTNLESGISDLEGVKGIFEKKKPFRDSRFKIRTMRRACVLLLAFFAFGFNGCSRHSNKASTNPSVQTLYHCAMHPQIISDKPGECPICHMRLIPFEKGGLQSPVSSGPSGVSGQAAVQMSSDVQQRIGVTIAPAEIRDLSVPIRAAAKVAYDPQLYNAIVEHQEAQNFFKKAKAQGSEDLIDQAQSTLRSSRLRLRQMGLSEDQISEISDSGYNASSLLLGSKGGRLWVYANVFDYEASLIHPGQPAELSSPSVPGRIFQGTVEAVDAILNSDTRTLRVRIGVSDSGGVLRPESYLSATIHAALGKRLAIPESALVDTGTRQLVYVETSSGTFEPREVRAGRRAEGYYEIVQGLKEGERVATSANFLIDSESRIRAATEKAAGQ